MKIYTIRDIAQIAGVSVTTVSRVLNNRPDVSEETARRVREVMDACHFVGNANARSLKQADPSLVAVIIRGRMNPFLNALTEAILLGEPPERAAMVTEYIDEQADEFRRAATLIHERRIQGLIFIGSRIDDRCEVLSGVNLPMVFLTVSTEGTAMARASSVCMDDRALAREAVSALFQRGCRRVAVFGGAREGADSLALRAQGAAEACAAHGAPLDERDYVTTRLSLSDAHAAALRYFSAGGGADAAFCMSDMVAMGVMRALSDLGRRVPDDVSGMGVDGIEMGEYMTPRLSTVVQPVDEIARRGLEVLSDMIYHGAPARHVTLGGALRLRESVRPAR